VKLLKYSIIAVMLTVVAYAPARSAPTLVANVHGYTLAGDKLQSSAHLRSKPEKSSRSATLPACARSTRQPT